MTPRNLFISALSLLLCGSVQAKVTLPSIISDNMVLQQKTDANIWGWTDAGKKVTITCSWAKKKTTVTANGDGEWIAAVRTPQAGGPYEITVSDGEKITLKNILIGEVWFCSGQSNMEMPVKGYPGQPVEGSARTVITARPSTQIRMCTIPRKSSMEPLSKPSGSWLEHTPENVGPTSATAYFFAQTLNEVLDIPVGILIADWGGTAIEAWMSRETLESKFPGEFKLDFKETGKPASGGKVKPTTLYNGQIHPAINYTIKGTIWYQGESNKNRAEQYSRLQPAFIEMLRHDFRNPQMPFYFVQIAPYIYEGVEKRSAAYLREAQEKTLDAVPNTGMAVTLDIGNKNCIHPRQKPEVGSRLAYIALDKTYGKNGIDAISPRFKSAKFEDGKAIVNFIFKDKNSHLAPLNEFLEGFELAGEDKVFHPAIGKIAKDRISVTVTSKEVPNPVAVRYCFTNCPQGTLFNDFCIPAAPFRSDDWK